MFEKAQVAFWIGVRASAVVSAMTVRLSVRICTRPRIVVIVPRVTMKALMPDVLDERAVDEAEDEACAEHEQRS